MNYKPKSLATPKKPKRPKPTKAAYQLAVKLVAESVGDCEVF
jgi:hypothetical protein